MKMNQGFHRPRLFRRTLHQFRVSTNKMRRSRKSRLKLTPAPIAESNLSLQQQIPNWEPDFQKFLNVNSAGGIYSYFVSYSAFLLRLHS